jgi:hypothetical protein
LYGLEQGLAKLSLYPKWPPPGRMPRPKRTLTRFRALQTLQKCKEHSKN